MTDDVDSIAKYELFQVELNNDRAGAAVATTDDIAHIATITSTAAIATVLQSVTSWADHYSQNIPPPSGGVFLCL